MSGPFQVLSHQSLRSDNDVPRDGVRKLSDVSWPLCVLQVVQRLPAERLRSHAELFLATRKKMLGHQRNVFAAFPQWRQLQAYKDRKSTRLNSSHPSISYAVFCLKKKKERDTP